MKKVIIIDDEPDSIEILKYELEQIGNGFQVVDTCSDARKAADVIQKTNPDIVFLDIEMPWLSGFEVLDKVSDINFKIIFVTAYNQYAIRAFKYFAFDYLLKPVERNLLKETLERINEQTDLQLNFKLENLLNLLNNRDLEDEKIALPTQTGYEFYNLTDIIRCQADSNYTKVILKNGKILLASKTLKHIQEKINNSNFIRVHQSHLINVKHIMSYSKTDGGEVLMADNVLIPISRSKRKEFFDKMNLDG